MPSSAVLKELAITAELCGAALTDAAAMALVRELETEREDDLLAGLRKMRREHRGRFTLADVLDFASEAKKERVAKRKLCLWCPVEVVPAKDYCPEHQRHYDEIQAGRTRAIDPKQLTKAVFKNA